MESRPPIKLYISLLLNEQYSLTLESTFIASTFSFDVVRSGVIVFKGMALSGPVASVGLKHNSFKKPISSKLWPVFDTCVTIFAWVGSDLLRYRWPWKRRQFISIMLRSQVQCYKRSIPVICEMIILMKKFLKIEEKVSNNFSWPAWLCATWYFKRFTMYLWTTLAIPSEAKDVLPINW